MLLEFMGVSLTVLWGRWLTADPTVAQIRHSNLDSRGQFFDTSGQGTAGQASATPLFTSATLVSGRTVTRCVHLRASTAPPALLSLRAGQTVATSARRGSWGGCDHGATINSMGGCSRACSYPAGVIPELEIVKPRPEVTLQVTPLASDRQLKGPSQTVWP